LNASVSIPESEVDSLFWGNIETLNCSICFDPIAEPSMTTTYIVSAISDDGCFATDNVTVFVDDELSVFIPNVFTPNGDNNNDYFTIYSTGITLINELRIYDRWGNNVFTAYDFEPNIPVLGWDGRFANVAASSGVYAYYADVEFNDGSTDVFVGDVTIIR